MHSGAVKAARACYATQEPSAFDFCQVTRHDNSDWRYAAYFAQAAVLISQIQTLFLRTGDAMPKTCKILLLSMFLGAGVVHAAPILTADPLTKLPLIPATVGLLGNQPQSLDPATVCKSKMAANMYSVVNSTFAAPSTRRTSVA
jgi:hypothetical protein